MNGPISGQSLGGHVKLAVICYNRPIELPHVGEIGPFVENAMKRWDTVAIVGVGLIGGSIGQALLGRGLARQVVGIGRNPASLQQARSCGAVNITTTSLAKGVSEAEVVVVCTPVEQVVGHVCQAAEHAPEHAIITDVASTKQRIVSELVQRLPDDSHFVGSHPLAGGEKGGPSNARPDLLDGRTVVLTPDPKTRRSDVKIVSQFWKSLGSRIVQMPPNLHDEAVAATSHLPHLVASALAASTSEGDLVLASSGWLDTTRVAAGDVDLWRQIFMDNGSNVLKTLSRFEKQLAAFRQALEQKNETKITELLDAGKQRRDFVGG